MTLALTLVLSTVALTALFWGMAVVLQGYLYNQPADKLPVRALTGGLAVACFLTAWTYLNTRASHLDKYGVLFGFDHMMVATSTRDVDEFEAVRRMPRVKDEKGQPKEETVPFKWEPGATGGGRFVETRTTKEFKLNTSDYVTVALLVPEGEGRKVRFNAAMTGDAYDRGPGRSEPVQFREEGGQRFISEEKMRQMEVPSSGALVEAVAVNVLNYIVWFLAFWLALRFTFGHALGLAAVFGTVAMLVLMPLLFDMNKPKSVPLIQQQTPATPAK